MKIDFRPARASDLPEILEMMADFYRQAQIDFVADRQRLALGQLMEHPANGLLQCVLVDGHTIGYFAIGFGFSLEYGGRDAFVDELYLLRAYRGWGIGGCCIDEICRLCAAHGVRAVHLEVDGENLPAQQLYFRKGFQGNSRRLLTRTIVDTT